MSGELPQLTGAEGSDIAVVDEERGAVRALPVGKGNDASPDPPGGEGSSGPAFHFRPWPSSRKTWSGVVPDVDDVHVGVAVAVDIAERDVLAVGDLLVEHRTPVVAADVEET